jgi:dipeptidyl aminopeptidase/acylaminoacyl peptidase
MAEADARYPAPSSPRAAHGAGLDVHSMVGFARVGAPVASSDGARLAYAVRRYDASKKKWGSSLCLFELAAWEAAGAEAARASDFTVQLTRIAAGVNDRAPVFSPDGLSLAFSSNRSGSSQVWVLPSLSGPGEAVQLTDYPLDVGDVRWGAGDRLFFACAVFPSSSIEATAAKDKELEERKASGGGNAMSFTSLPVRQWDSWCDAKRNHVFVAPIERGGSTGGVWGVGEATDLLAGLDTDCPLKPFGGAEDYSVSPDGTSVVYCCRPPTDQASDQAWSTNTNLYLHLLRGDTPNPLDTPRRRTLASPAAFSDDEDEDLEDVPSSPAFKASPGGAADDAAAGCLTTGNEGYDTNPVYSPDGHQIAYLSMATPGYEADTNKIKVFDLRTGARREIASGWDASIDEICWAPDGSKLFCTSQCRGRKQVYSVALDDVSAGTKAEPVTLVAEHASAGLSVVGGRRLLFSQSSLCAPAEVFTCLADGSALCALSSINAIQLQGVTMGKVSELVCTGAKGEPVQSWLIHPAGFVPEAPAPAAAAAGAGADGQQRQYPLAVIVHGGPQGAILDSFGYRWNPQTYAGAGFAVLCVNFHGTQHGSLSIYLCIGALLA